MIGAMFWMRKASIRCSGDRYWRSVFFDRFDNVLDLGFEGVHLAGVRIRNEAAHDRDTLDQLRYALDKQHRETNHDQGLGRPLRQAAGVSRLLVDYKRTVEERDAGGDHHDGQRQQKEYMPHHINRAAQPLWQQVVYDIDADVLVGE